MKFSTTLMQTLVDLHVIRLSIEFRSFITVLIACLITYNNYEIVYNN